MSEELRPCPFCGGRHIETAENLDLVYCFDCGAEMHTDLGGAWNTRPIEDDLRKRIAELEALLGKLIEIGEWGLMGMVIATSYSGGKIHDLAERRQNEWLTLVKDWKEREE